MWNDLSKKNEFFSAIVQNSTDSLSGRVALIQIEV